MNASTTRKRGGLREAALDEAASIIADQGIEALSLREVARRLGVSHQAPYRHFPSREHLLAEVVARAFERFATALDARSRAEDPMEDLGQMGLAYVLYAQANPLEYRLIFGTPLPDLCAHPEMMRKASHAFDLLREALRRAHPDYPERTDLDALFVWSAVHGLVSILQHGAIPNLDIGNPTDEIIKHILDRIALALSLRS